MRRVGWTVGLVAALAVLLTALPASAAGEVVTLEATDTDLSYGQNTTLLGDVTPPPPAGTSVTIVDADDPATVLATTATDAAGHYATKLDQPPERNVALQAQVVDLAIVSDILLLKVRPDLTIRLGRTRLFHKSKVSGTVDPAHPGEQVRVTLLRAGKVVDRKHPKLSDDGTFRTRFRIMKLGRYRAKVRFKDEDHAAATRQSGRKKAPLPSNLSGGSKGTYVRALEWRLRSLDYRLPGANRSYDFKTEDAVMAFHKVQGMARTETVDGPTWKKLTNPFRPQPRARKPRFHIEIDQTRQVLYVVRKGEIDEIVHTSTGKASTPTHDGVFSVHRKIAGYSPNNLYYPSYFDGNRAVHGWPEVPNYAASHGCARVPYWTAIWLHDIMSFGTKVRVYHS
jgi:peptidoglycan hydrolase-like protein with peptidoglycan-binding domain